MKTACLLPLSALLGLLGGCATTEICSVDGLAAGDVGATIDGTEWTGTGASWSIAGDAFQITTADSDGWRLTLVASRTADDVTVATALAADGTVDVPIGNGSFGVLYPSGESSSYAANDVGAGDVLLTRSKDQLAACFDFTPTASDGSLVDVQGGLLLATCSGDACD